MPIIIVYLRHNKFTLTKGFIMSYLPENFDNFQESIINGGYDPRVVDNHPVAGGDDWMFGWDAEPYEDNPYDGTYSEE